MDTRAGCKLQQFNDVQSEYNRINDLTKAGFQPKELISGEKNNPVSFGSEKALEKFAAFLGYHSSLINDNKIPADKRSSFVPEQRQIRQVKELEDHVQWLLRDSDQKRNRFFLYKVMPEFGVRTWSNKPYHPYFSPDHFIEQAKEYRKYFHEEILGKFDEKMLPPNARTRKIYDKEKWTGYEVVLDVYTNLFATGILLDTKGY